MNTNTKYQEIEKQLEELKRQQEKLLQMKKQKAERKAKKEAIASSQVNKSPSPVKPHKPSDRTINIKPRYLAEDFKAESRKESQIPQGSTSYFLKALEENQNQDQSEKADARKLLNSRIYTFDKDLVCEPISVNEKEYFSGKQISKRYLTHESLAKFLEDKKVLRLSKLFAKVSPPEFEEPRYANWVVIGIISKKSIPRGTSDNKSKYITMTLTDFKLNIDIHIFGPAVEKYVKLRLGDIIAILNPEIYIWRPDHNGMIKSFSLSIKHTHDSILEIGKARDFGLCQSLKRDGTVCGTPIDKSLEDCCFFHKELRIRKTAGKRMELNGSFNLRSPTKNGRKQQFLMGGKDDMGNYKNSTIFEDRYAPKVDRTSKSMVYFSNPHAGKAFFNDSYQNPEILKNIEEKKRKIQERKKEATLRAKLLRLGEKSAVTKPTISNEEKLALQKKKALLKTAFQGDALQNLGYDPTSKPHSKGVLDADELIDKEDNVLRELNTLAQKKKISLGHSKEEVEKRKQQRHEADRLMKRIRSRKDEDEKGVEVSQKSVELDSDSDSDSSDNDDEINREAYKKFRLSQSAKG